MPLPPLLLLPGLLCDAVLWRAQQQGLRDDAIVAVADLTQDASLPAMAARLLGRAPPRFALAGLSMGGYLAFEILRQAPQRVTRLCLIATTAAPDDAATARRRRALMALVARHPRFNGVSQRLLPDLLHPDRLGDAALCAAIVDMSRRVGREAYLRQQQAILDRPDSRPGLAALHLPTLILTGEADRVTPPDAARDMAALIRGARLQLVAGAAHLPPLEQPDAVTAALRDWLTARPSPVPP